MINKKCQICKNDFKIHLCNHLKGYGRTCSRECHFKWQKIRKYLEGKDHWLWKGGKTKDHGYIVIKIYGKRRKEHRAIMEEYLGRKLKKSEHIHHINGIRDDNRIENLQILSVQEHGKMHVNNFYKNKGKEPNL